MTRDERISAWLDNALSDAERSAFEAEMAANPILAAQVEKLSANDDALRAAFASPMAQDVPDHLMEMLRAEPVEKNTNARPTVAQRAWLAWGGGAVAATLALALFLSPSPRGNEGQIADTIGSIASLETKTLATGARLTPQLSFPSLEGGHCRQFMVVENGNAKSGLACHKAGRWSVRGLEPMMAPADGGGYAPASGSSAAHIDALSEKLRDGDPLDAASETALIAKKWRTEGE